VLLLLLALAVLLVLVVVFVLVALGDIVEPDGWGGGACVLRGTSQEPGQSERSDHDPNEDGLEGQRDTNSAGEHLITSYCALLAGDQREATTTAARHAGRSRFRVICVGAGRQRINGLHTLSAGQQPYGKQSGQ
jgi:hypothetical protein